MFLMRHFTSISSFEVYAFKVGAENRDFEVADGTAELD